MTTAPRILVVDRAPVFAAGVEAAFARMNHPVTLEHLKHLPSLDALPQPAPDLCCWKLRGARSMSWA